MYLIMNFFKENSMEKISFSYVFCNFLTNFSKISALECIQLPQSIFFLKIC